MKNWILLFVGAAGLIGAGFFLGVASTSSRVAEASNSSALFWLLAIERDLQSGNIERAKELTLNATDGTLHVLDRLSSETDASIALSFLNGEMSIDKEPVLDSAKVILASRLDELSQESQAFLGRQTE